MRRRVSISLAPDVLQKLQMAARKEQRSISSMISVLIMGGLARDNARQTAKPVGNPARPIGQSMSGD